MRTNSYHQMEKKELMMKIEGLSNNGRLDAATIKVVFVKDSSGDWQYYIGKCELGSTPQKEKEEIYSEHAFICKSISDFDMNDFLESLDKDGISISSILPPIRKTKKSDTQWIEEIIPSHATVSGFPVRKYSSRINSDAHFHESILLGFDMPFILSSGEYLKNFLGMWKFHGYQDARNGELSIEIPDRRGRICISNGKIWVENGGFDTCLVGQTTKESNFILKNKEKIEFDEKYLGESELWLLTKENEILDFRSKTERQYWVENSDNKEIKLKQLLAIIERGESQETEFKTYIEVTKNKNKKSTEIEKAVCALSNAHGGNLFFGVTDDGCIEGVDEKVRIHYKMELVEAVEAYIKDIGKQLRETLKDSQCFDISAVKLGNKYVVVISVDRSKETNYYVNSRVAFIRKGATSFKMTSAEEREKTNQSHSHFHD